MSASQPDREPTPFTVIGFASTHEALDAEQALLAVGIDVVPVPAPTQLSTRCGIALRVARAQEQSALNVLAAQAVDTTEILRILDF